jgi:hypothetical protein
MLSFGDPRSFAPAIHGAEAKLICQEQTVAQAREAVEAGADVIVSPEYTAARERGDFDIAGVELSSGGFVSRRRTWMLPQWHPPEQSMHVILCRRVNGITPTLPLPFWQTM